MPVFPRHFPRVLLLLTAALACAPATRAADDTIHAKFTVCAVAICGELAKLQIPLPQPAKATRQPWLEVPLNELNTSATFDYKGPPAVRFFATANAATKPVATATLPAGGDSLVLVMVPNPTNDGYRVIVVADAEFAFGSYYLQNLSPHPVAVDLGGKKQILVPAAKAVMPGGGGADQDVKIYASINGQQRLIKSSSWRLDANQREMVFFHTPPGTEQVVSKHIVSMQPEQKAAKP